MIILVSGLPGSGKSYFAENLASRLKAAYINSDRVRASLLARGRYSYEDKLDVYKEMLYRTEEHLGNGKDVVVDATFYRHAMRELFLLLAQRYDAPVRIIKVAADEDMIRQRLQKKREYSEADFSVYEKIRDDFEEITLPYLVVRSTNDNLEAMIAQAVKYLNSEGT